jgi:oligopeptide/dipeptide ABC transporter ATP-binding protein
VTAAGASKLPVEEPAPAPGDGRGNGEGPLLDVRHLKHYFPVYGEGLLRRRTGSVHAVDDVSFTVAEGETVGLVGESGCGKSTLLRCVMRIHKPDSGEIHFGGTEIARLRRRALRPVYHDLQMVFQDPYSSLNPRRRVGEIVAAPLRRNGVSRADARERVRKLLADVGLAPEHAARFPHEFSGGQRQRIGLARALALGPRMIALDEPVSALDVSVQAQIVNLLEELQERHRLAYLFVAHDLGVVRHISDRVIVMYLGKIVETAPADTLYERPVHPYTLGLLGAVPIPDPKEARAATAAKRQIIEGEVPSPIDPPSGCRFHPRCPLATDVCRTVEPPLVAYPDGRAAACHHPRNVDAGELEAAKISRDSPASAGEASPTLDVSPAVP